MVDNDYYKKVEAGETLVDDWEAYINFIQFCRHKADNRLKTLLSSLDNGTLSREEYHSSLGVVDSAHPKPEETQTQFFNMLLLKDSLFTLSRISFYWISIPINSILNH